MKRFMVTVKGSPKGKTNFRENGHLSDVFDVRRQEIVHNVWGWFLFKMVKILRNCLYLMNLPSGEKNLLH